LPATPTSGLGLDQVWGRTRVAHPAVGMTIFKLVDMVLLYSLFCVE
jgi:hypothetical protein